MATKITRDHLLARIKRLEDAITIANEYLDTGKHADWKGFRPLFAAKLRAGKELPPHRDWVRNVFLPRRERALNRAEKLLRRFAD
jgi:hypothetical protein